MNNWYGKIGDPDDDIPLNADIHDFNEASVNDLVDQDSNGDEETYLPEILAYRDLIFKSPSYSWLYERLRNEFRLTPTEPNSMECIRRNIIHFLHLLTKSAERSLRRLSN